MREANSEAMKVGTFANRGLVLVTSTLAVYNMAGLAVPVNLVLLRITFYYMACACFLSPVLLDLTTFVVIILLYLFFHNKNELCML